MDFATVARTMSAPVERRIPRSRRPSIFEVTTIERHQLFSYLVTDERWSVLGKTSRGKSLQRLVLKTAKETHAVTSDELLKRAKALDAEIPQSQYLKAEAERSSTLIDLYGALSDIFHLHTASAAQKFERIPTRILQFNYAGRLLGRKLELEFGWDPRYKFGALTHEAQTAINLCTDAIREVIPPHI